MAQKSRECLYGGQCGVMLKGETDDDLEKAWSEHMATAHRESVKQEDFKKENEKENEKRTSEKK